ncbi:Ribonuclease VapC [Tumidithrix helvetica PCC 7403]|uniref:type II toxin-antitoxin system VapC family toxin n=1 Tax=Tumidithrix helvetica TaxID=3457545 RepID=UPI003C9A853C
MIKVETALNGVTKLFLDTAPVIYFVEANPKYLQIVESIFDRIENGLTAITSPVTLAECLVIPYRLGLMQLQQDFTDLIVDTNNITFTSIDEACAKSAADIRARYNLSLPDALQISVAIGTGCDTFLTNDVKLKRVTELRVLVIDELNFL